MATETKKAGKKPATSTFDRAREVAETAVEVPVGAVRDVSKRVYDEASRLVGKVR